MNVKSYSYEYERKIMIDGSSKNVSVDIAVSTFAEKFESTHLDSSTVKYVLLFCQFQYLSIIGNMFSRSSQVVEVRSVVDVCFYKKTNNTVENWSGHFIICCIKFYSTILNFPAFSHIPFLPYMLSNGVSKPMFKAICDE
jgi:hypothetical protein